MLTTHGSIDASDRMKNSSYGIVPIHKRPDLFEECCRIINAEWPASKIRRLRSFGESCDELPTCLVLLKGEKVIGHCKLSPIPGESQSCFLGSVVIDYVWRSQGLGSMLLRGAEEYAAKKSIKQIYLTTKGQEGFYKKNGYIVCPPINIWNYIIPPRIPRTSNANPDKKQIGPPPPPLPPMPLTNLIRNTSSSPLKSSKTYMLKRL